MNIGIIGAGFTGLSAAYKLAKKGHRVTVFEKDNLPGGLAIGYQPASPQGGEQGWEWTLEKHYHHWFANDTSVLNLAKEISFEILLKRPKTSVYVDNAIYQLDSPLSVLQFPKLAIHDRIRMAAVLGILKYNPFWQPLEKIRASDFLPIAMGQHAYKLLWEPQLQNKFSTYTNEISLAWFWARIKKRTATLAYPKGGFLTFAQALVKKIEEQGGKVLFNTEVISINNNKNSIYLKASSPRHSGKPKAHPESDSGQARMTSFNFDKVIVTLPSFFFLKIAPNLPVEYQNKLKSLQGLGAINLVLRLKESFLKDGTYWLSICDKKSPIMAIVEHTNFMDKKYYNNEHIVYLGNYLPANHPYMQMSADELLKIYDPYLKKINPHYSSFLIHNSLFNVPFAQPIIPINYSKIMPPFQTPLKHVLLANIQQVYPWDRGTNYAVELGEKVATLIHDQ